MSGFQSLRTVVPSRSSNSRRIGLEVLSPDDEAAILKCTTYLITVSHPIRLESSVKPL
jgi:hypothetical protein